MLKNKIEQINSLLSHGCCAVLTISSAKSSRKNSPSDTSSVKDIAAYLILERWLIFTEKRSESLLLHVLFMFKILFGTYKHVFTQVN